MSAKDITSSSLSARQAPWELSVGPPPACWDDWTELDPAAWPTRKEKHYRCIPTICFNCESACGLLAFVDKESGEIQKFEGNPVHVGSRGRTCAKGPATINQVKDGDRILKPLRRVGARGAGQFEEVSWEVALEDIAGRIAKAFDEDRHNEVVYHVGRPGEDHFVNRMLTAWGIDGHNSHTNVCSAGARLGYTLWLHADRPAPDHTNAKFILLLSAHLETGHYFNPHAQRIMDARQGGAKVAVVDTRLSNTSTHSDYWISPWPGTESALLLGVAHKLLSSGRFNKEFVRRWTNWEEYLSAHDEGGPGTFERFIELTCELYESFTPEFVAEECKISPDFVDQLADEIASAGTAFASHLWRNTAAGHEGGWQVARALVFLHVLTGSIGTKGGLDPNSWNKFVPKPPLSPPPITRWNERHWPKEWPLSHYEMSFLLPHLLRDQGSKLDVYFTRVYNPVWTNPDGCAWIEMLEDEERVGCHVALSPTWSETAQWADYVLPMGLAPERHDVMSQETHSGTWIGFRQPVLREYARLEGAEPDTTLGHNPGEVWEEAEFWIALTKRIDPDGSRGILKYFESKSRPGEAMTMDEYWSDVFENSVPGLPEAAEKEGLAPLEYMRRFGAYEVPYKGKERYEDPRGADEDGVTLENGERKAGFPTPSKKLEFYSSTLQDWGFGEHAVPGYIRSQVHWKEMDFEAGDRALLPTFRLPTLIHTRSANAKWLQEISHTNPLWVHPSDAEKLGLENGGLVRVNTQLGYFVPRVWVTEGIHPGVVACSHHVGRWRLYDRVGGTAMSSSMVGLERDGSRFLFRQKGGAGPLPKGDTDEVWWKEIGVNQNLTFAVQPDPMSGMHCWHQKVRVEAPSSDDRYGDVCVDTGKSWEVYQEWKQKTRPAPGPGGLRRPLWMHRPLHPAPEAYRM
jgi:anaerobic selenocysteine-containing dehydrogenase